MPNFNSEASVVASGARTATSNTSARQTGYGRTVSVMLDVTAVSGTTPSMTVSVEWSPDGTTFFPVETPDAFTAITATKKVAKSFTVKGAYWRLVWTISGTTPSFTFAAHAHWT